MKNLKFSLLALSLVTLTFISCAEKEEVKEVQVIEVKTTERIIEREKEVPKEDGNKVDVGLDTDDGKVNVEINDKKNKIDIELGKDDNK